jgi:predicted lipoprotein with Yx(FWY)xxD motif
MKRRSKVLMAAAVPAVLIALLVAGCGSSGSDNVKVSPPAASAKASTPNGGGATVDVRTSGLGRYLVDSQGRTLYLFEKDTGTKSMCSGACASVWPPSTTSGRPKAGADVDQGLLGTTAGSDGKTQLTYNGHPLYRYAGDQAAGDTNGQGLTQFGGGWDVVSPGGQKIEGHGSSSTSDSSGSNGSSYGY